MGSPYRITLPEPTYDEKQGYNFQYDDPQGWEFGHQQYEMKINTLAGQLLTLLKFVKDSPEHPISKEIVQALKAVQ